MKFFGTPHEVNEYVAREGRAAFARMSMETYRGTQAISQSTLSKMKQSPSKFKWEMDHPRPSTDAQILGSAIHMALLEPDVFEMTYKPKPKFDRRTKIGKESAAAWEAANGGYVGLSDDDFDTLNRVIARAKDSEFFMQFFAGELQEVSFFAKDPITGLILRGRTDNFLLEKNVIVDLKTTDCAHESVFNHDIYKYGYDTQAAYYMDLVQLATGKRPDGYVIVAIEKSKDCDMNIFVINDDDLERCSNQNRMWLDQLHDCMQVDKWPGYEERFIEYRMPGYAAQQLEQISGNNFKGKGAR